MSDLLWMLEYSGISQFKLLRLQHTALELRQDEDSW